MEPDFEAALAADREEQVAPEVEVLPVKKADPIREATWEAVVQAVASGVSLQKACALSGASYQAVRRLIKADPAREREIKQAKAKLVSALTGTVVEAALGDGESPGDWRAAAWLLPKLDSSLQERKKPTVSITNQTLTVNEAQQVKGMSSEELRKLLGG